MIGSGPDTLRPGRREDDAKKLEQRGSAAHPQAPRFGDLSFLRSWSTDGRPDLGTEQGECPPVQNKSAPLPREYAGSRTVRNAGAPAVVTEADTGAISNSDVDHADDPTGRQNHPEPILRRVRHRDRRAERVFLRLALDRRLDIGDDGTAVWRNGFPF